jgi:lysozyme
MDMERVRKTLVRHEGLRLKPYKCTAGKLTIGVGRNLDDVGITEETAMTMLTEDIKNAISDLRKNFSWFETMPPIVQEALVNLAFNMGMGTLKQFVGTLGHLENRRWDKAATGLLDSRYARQVGKRAEEVADMIRAGDV